MKFRVFLDNKQLPRIVSCCKVMEKHLLLFNCFIPDQFKGLNNSLYLVCHFKTNNNCWCLFVPTKSIYTIWNTSFLLIIKCNFKSHLMNYVLVIDPIKKSKEFDRNLWKKYFKNLASPKKSWPQKSDRF